MNDILSAIRDPELGAAAFRVIRPMCTVSHGNTTRTAQVFQAMGCIHPGPPELLKLLPEEERHETFIVIYTAFPLSLGGEPRRKYLDHRGPDSMERPNLEAGPPAGLVGLRVLPGNGGAFRRGTGMTQEISSILFRALCACLEVSPSAASSSALIRRAYQDPEPAPEAPRTQDVIYYDLLPETAPDAGYATCTNENPQASGAYPAVSSFLPYRLVIVCYGPDCEENARKIHSFLYLDGNGYPRSILRKAGIYPVPRPPMPVLIREETGGMFRLRADLEIRLRIRETLVRENRRFTIQQVPAVTIVDSRNRGTVL